MSLQKFEQLCLTATRCRVCFDNLDLAASKVDIAQPRWVGPDYWKATNRVAIVLLNPGSGAYRKDSADETSRGLIKEFLAGNGTFAAILEHQVNDIKNWGRGRFARFYLENLGLKAEAIALANVAWCATNGNKYPMKMLTECFQRHTQELLRILDPHIILLSGTKTHRFVSEIAGLLPEAKIVPILHYAHRKGHEADEQETKRVRKILQELR